MTKEQFTELYAAIEQLLPEDGIIDDSCSLINEIIELIQKREARS